MAEEEISPVTYEQLAAIEDEFDAVDLEIMRQQYKLSKPIYAKRAEVVAKIPNFWALVFEECGPEIDPYITPDDSRVLVEHLKELSVTRPELETDGKDGHPRSFTIRFEFAENDLFENKVLEKHFSHRRSKNGWSGLVSEPVKINWKKGKDMTEGLTDLAVALFEARKKGGDMKSKKHAEYEALKTKVESWNAANTSFFTWFGFVSDYRWVSAEESAAANREYAAKKAEREKNPGSAEEEDDDDNEEDMDDDDEEVEVCENGEDLAIAIAEDLWPNAIKFFTGSQEDMSDLEFEDMDEDDEDDDDDEDEDAGNMQDILTNGEGPPAKKAKK